MTMRKIITKIRMARNAAQADRSKGRSRLPTARS